MSSPHPRTPSLFLFISLTLNHLTPLHRSGHSTHHSHLSPPSLPLQSYSMQLYLRQVWFDPRLRFNKTDLGKTEFSMNWMFAAKLWKPDTFFINGKNSYAHKITAPNTFIRLQYDGQITWSLRWVVLRNCGILRTSEERQFRSDILLSVGYKMMF